MKVEEIAYAVVRDARTIERWIKDFGDRRMGSIFSGMAGNDHAGKLTKEQKEEIKKVLDKKPSSYGLPKEFWDVPQLKKYVYARFGAVYETDRSYHFLLEYGNLSFKVPDKFNVRRTTETPSCLIRLITCSFVSCEITLKFPIFHLRPFVISISLISV